MSRAVQVEICIEEPQKKEPEPAQEKTEGFKKETPTLTREDDCKLIKKVVHLAAEGKVSAWLNRNKDWEDSEVTEVLNKFFTRSGTYGLSKEVANGDLQSIAGWIETTKRKGESIDKNDEANGLNALHYAIIFKQKEIVKTLLEYGASAECCSRGMISPLQLAILSPTPFSDGIELLTTPPYSCKDVDQVTKWGSALDFAVKEDRLEGAICLIEHGASPTHCWMGKTSLERAIQKRNKAMVRAMLDGGGAKGEAMGEAMGRYKEKLKTLRGCTSCDQTAHGHSPFADLVTDLPDIAEMVLDHCVSTKHAPHERNYEISFDCSLFENETSRTNKCSRGLPCSCFCECISNLATGKTNFDPNDLHSCNFDDEESGGEYDAFEKYHHPLYKVMESNQPNLLKHPVVLALLDKKLKRFGWLLYYTNLLVYIALVIFLTAFILLMPNSQNPNCSEIRESKGNFSLSRQNFSLSNSGNFSLSNSRNFSLSNSGNFSLTNSENLTSESKCSSRGLDSHLTALTVLKGICLILAFTRFIIELLQMYSRKVVGYLNDWVNWFELAEYLSVIIFLISVESNQCFCSQRWEWELGVVSLALSWVVLIVWLQAMHWMGIYVTIMIRIIVSFARVALFGALLVVGFGLTFYLLFYQPPQDQTMNVPSTFSYPVRSVLSVISLTAGDVDMDSVFYSDNGNFPPPGRQYESLAFLIWLAAVVIMSVLFNNLLVGLAVGEVSSVIEEARITTIKQRIDLVLTQEEQLPEFFHRRIIQTGPIIVHPNQQSGIIHIPKVVLWSGCSVCSLLCFNVSHFRYWGHVIDSDTMNQSRKFMEVPGLIEKARLNTAVEVERGEIARVTKQDLQNLRDELSKMKKELLSEIRKL